MSKISSRQQAILEFIRNEVRLKGYPPSVREIGEAVGLASSSTVHGHLDRLEKKGLIRRDPTKPRAIELLGQDESDNSNLINYSISRVPVVGKVTAGLPITATENIEDYFPLPQHFVGEDKIFMLSVVGESMIEAGIANGDYVIVRQQQTADNGDIVVRQQQTADNGDIVVAMTDEDEATVKTFYKEKDHIRLQPENPAFEPLRLTHVSILGKVVGLFRDFH
ncbi:transcriptional repressor LexA [Paenibacillus polymyxa]|uniref:transcriptional repressor LexA n=3 Tax=Paenibacillus TaxID=44249 RepID=UPI0006C13D6E|nr:transcriptional repressor LexA [Paenibacillus polymyxa]KOS03209.1 XRE family transcriptional regulator [Paenibacillus polymyxa]